MSGRSQEEYATSGREGGIWSRRGVRVPVVAALVILIFYQAVFWLGIYRGEVYSGGSLASNVTRGIFVAIVVVMPLGLFYLHAVLRRESAFNSFYTALNRLGLLDKAQIKDRKDEESDIARHIRIMGYGDRFAAVYAVPPVSVHERLLDPARFARPGTGPHFGSELDGPTLRVPYVLSLLLFIGWCLVLPPINACSTNWHEALRPDYTVINMAFLGTVVFYMEMLRRRFMLRDLNVNVYLAFFIRVILTIAFVSVLLADIDKNQANSSLLLGMLPDGTSRNVNPLLLAFLLGFLPFGTLWNVAIAYVAKIPGMGAMFRLSKNDMKLHLVEGIDIFQEARLEEEDVRDVQNLAYTNLVHLIVNTRYSPDRLVDWVDQAILIAVLGPREIELAEKSSTNAPDADDPKQAILPLFRRYGIRSATDLYDIMRKSDSDAPDAHHFPDFLKMEGIKDRIYSLRDILEHHPNFPLVRNWRLETCPSPIVRKHSDDGEEGG